MHVVLDVLQKLSIDSTFFIQLALVIIFYFILRQLLFGKLQFVIELRDSKTTKMEENANHKFTKAEVLANEYSAETEKAYAKAQEQYSAKKNEIVAREKARLKEIEAEVSKEAEKEKEQIKSEIASQESKVMASSDELAENLIKKIIH